MLAYINGRTSDHISTLLFSAVWGFFLALTNYLNGTRPDAIGTFLLATAIGMASGGLLGWIVSKFTKNEQHIVGVANWYLIIAITLHVVINYVILGMR